MKTRVKDSATPPAADDDALFDFGFDAPPFGLMLTPIPTLAAGWPLMVAAVTSLTTKHEFGAAECGADAASWHFPSRSQ